MSVVPVSIPVPGTDIASQSRPCPLVLVAASGSFSTQYSKQPLPFIGIKGVKLIYHPALEASLLESSDIKARLQFSRTAR